MHALRVRRGCAGVVLSFTLGEVLPDIMGPRNLVEMMGGREKVKFVELNEVRQGMGGGGRQCEGARECALSM